MQTIGSCAGRWITCFTATISPCPKAGFGSDHFALFTELVLETGYNVQQSGLKANEDDLAWAKDKADDQDVSKNDVPRPETF